MAGKYAMWSEYRQRRREKGLCEKCGKRPLMTACLCSVCNDKMKARGRARAARLISAGKCIFCGKSEPIPGTKECPACKERRYRRDKARESNRLSRGLCARCDRPVVKGKTRCESCLETLKARSSAVRRQRNAAGVCVTCGSPSVLNGQRRCGECRDKALAKYQKLKDAVFAGYGGYVCKCCGETESAFLSLDHVDNDGAADRREFGCGWRFLRVVLKEGCTRNLQVLCMNCQWGKRLCGTCPHKKRQSERG